MTNQTFTNEQRRAVREVFDAKSYYFQAQSKLERLLEPIAGYVDVANAVSEAQWPGPDEEVNEFLKNAINGYYK